MPVQTFRSPNFFDREIDLSAPAEQGPVGVPAGIIGTANRGPAFVPVTVGNFDQFVATFGNLDPKRFGPYAANAFLANRQALTFMRVLGAGANSSATDIARTQQTGRVLNAGFRLDGSAPTLVGATGSTGGVQFIVAKHTKQSAEAFGQADFTDNDSFNASTVNLVRGVVMMASGARLQVTDYNRDLRSGRVNSLADFGSTDSNGSFKLIISTSIGSSYFTNDSNPGVRILTASLDPSSPNYFAKVLNTDPDKFLSAQHLLYTDFAVDEEIASTKSSFVAVLSGTQNRSTITQDTAYTGAPYNDKTSFQASFGAFDTRFRAPKTSFFISQPFGATEYDLFAIESLDDGEFANKLYKVSISNLKASLDAANPYGTFSVQIRDWNDNDTSPLILEQFNNCSLDPDADNYVAKVIGDRKVYFNFDATDPAERRLIAAGKYPNNSTLVRVVMNDAVDRGQIPGAALPFGFRGINVLKTNDTLTDHGLTASDGTTRINGILSSSAAPLSASIVPPVPFRSKVTKGARDSVLWFGKPGINELSVPLYYWGVKFERNDISTDPNIETLPNNLLASLTQFQGIEKLDMLVTGSGADLLNNNKFTLARVAFSNLYPSSADLSTVLTASIDSHMREAAYIRNGRVDTTIYTVPDTTIVAGGGNRITFATILGRGTPSQFNRFGPYLKFTNFMAGGFDGVNMLDSNARRLNDRSTSFDSSTYGAGGAYSGFVPDGFASNQNGSGQSNNGVASHVSAINIMTDGMQVNHNLLAIPGIREPFITDYAGQKVKEYGLAFYVMDIPKYDDVGNRIFTDSTSSTGGIVRPDVNQTATGLDTRAIDNNYMGTYFPDIFIDDATNRRRVRVPASIAALGALGFNDRVGYPWFAPAGFNRAALDFVTNVEVRLTSSDKDRLYDSRINPIATFPRQGFVIFGQKTLQIKSSALDRVNVRRLLLEVKRLIINIALKLEFEQNTPDVRNKFVSDAALQLGLIQSQAGIEAFQVIMNETNNTQADVDLNKLNGRIVVVPTRVIEFIAVDFIITNSGVQFV